MSSELDKSNNTLRMAPFPFHLYNFVIPCVSDYLSPFELFQFYQCSADLKLQISVVWKRRAVKLGLLRNESLASGVKECFAFLDSQFQGKSYKTYIRKRFLLTLEDINHVLEPTMHKTHGLCHIVSISEALRICSLKYDGIDNFLKIKKQRDEEERQRLLKFAEDKRSRSEFLNVFSNQLSEIESKVWNSRLKDLRHSLQQATASAQMSNFDKSFDELKILHIQVTKNSDIFEQIFACNLYSDCEKYLELEFGEEMRDKFQKETGRLNMIKSLPVWEKFKKLSSFTVFQCREFVRDNLDGMSLDTQNEDEYEYEKTEEENDDVEQRLRNIKWKKLKALLEEEDWLITNTRFLSIKLKEFDWDEEYRDEMAGYASEGWESEDEERNSAMIDHTNYKFKRELALSEYFEKQEMLDLSSIPNNLHAEVSRIFRKTRTMRKLLAKYKQLPSGISHRKIEEFDAYIEHAISRDSYTTPPIHQAWIRKIIHQMAQERKLYTKTTKTRILISKYRIIEFDDS